MKPILLLFLFPVIAFSQTPTQKLKAKQMIQKYMNENLNDIKSYSPVLSTFVADWSRFGESIEEIRLEKKLDDLNTDLNNYNRVIETKAKMLREDSMGYVEMERQVPEFRWVVEKSDSIRSEIQETANELNQKRILYSPYLIGYIVTHKFRAKNALGGIVLTEWYFLFDPKFESIINVTSDYLEVDKGLF